MNPMKQGQEDTAPTWDPERWRYPQGKEGAPLFEDLAPLLSGGFTPPEPEVFTRDDGRALFYKGAVNCLYGESEAGKSWIAVAAMAEVLKAGGKAIYFDADENTAGALASRLSRMGVPDDVIINPHRCLISQVEDREQLPFLVNACRSFRPDIAVIDAVGRIMSLMGADSNRPDDYSRVHLQVFSAVKRCGAAVVLVDHPPKNKEKAALGASGTIAKRNNIDGSYLHVTLEDGHAYTRGQGGASWITVQKDRHGQVRAYCPTDDKEPTAARFVMRESEDGMIGFELHAPATGQRSPAERADPNLVERLAAHPDLDNLTARDARSFLGCRMDKVSPALREAKAIARDLSTKPRDVTAGVTPLPTPGEGNGVTERDGLGADASSEYSMETPNVVGLLKDEGAA